MTQPEMPQPIPPDSHPTLPGSEELYRSMLRMAIDGFCLLDTSGRILDINEAYCRMTGYTRCELLRMAVSDLEAVETPEAMVRHLATLMQSGAGRFETRHRRRDGSVLDVEVSVNYFAADGGRFFCCVRDISQRTRMEEALRRRTQQVEAVRSVGTEITHELELSALLALIIRRAVELVGGVSGAIYLWDAIAEVLVPRAWVGHGDWLREVRIRLGEGIAGTVAQRREGLLVNDYRASPYALSVFLERTGHGAALSEPLLYRDRLIGTIVVDLAVGRFTEQDREGLLLLAAQAAIAIENARLYEEARRELAERSRTEAALAQERNLLRALIDNIPDRIHIKDSAGRYVIDNLAHRHFLGASNLEEIVGRTIYDFWPRDVAEQFDRYDLGVIDSQQGLINREERFVERQTGDVVWSLTTTIPLKDDQGNVHALVSISRDITERKQMEEALSTRTRQLEVVRGVSEEITRELDLTRLLDLIVRLAVHLAGADGGSIYLWTESEHTLVPHAWTRHEDWMAGHRLQLGQGMAGMVASRREGMIVNDYRHWPAASPLVLERSRIAAVLAEPLLYRGQLVGVIVLDADEGNRRFTEEDRDALAVLAPQVAIAIENARLFAELKRAYQDLQRAQDELVRSEKLHALGQMAAGMAHDLNNVLAAVLGQAELLRLRLPDPAVHEALSTLMMAATDGAQIVRRLQDFARQQPGRPLSPVDLVGAVGEALEITRPQWKEEPGQRGLAIQVETRLADLPPVLGHAAEIREALTNLILNAVDAMPKGGVLTLTGRVTRVVDKPGEFVELTIMDTGVGMTDEVRRRVFDPFFTTKGVKGTGLGLSVVYGIMQRHGGHIDLVSALGQGTTFILRFQVATEAAGAPQATEAARAFAPRRLLLIDDDATVRCTLADLLRAAGHAVTEFEDGSTGLAYLSQNPADLVLTDLGMPQMSGWDVAREIKAGQARLPVVLLTGWGEYPASHTEYAGLVDRILGKPIRLNELLIAIENLTRPANRPGGDRT